MEHDEHEMMVEYSEMTSFNFNSREYKEVVRDFKKFEETANLFEGILEGFVQKFKPQHSC